MRLTPCVLSIGSCYARHCSLLIVAQQMVWLRMIRDHIISSFHIERDDLETAPFDSQGGLGKMYQLFGDKMDSLIDELNEALAA